MQQDGRKVTTDLAIPLATDNLLGLLINLASNATTNIIKKLGRKVSKKNIARSRRVFNLFISNVDINDKLTRRFPCIN